MNEVNGSNIWDGLPPEWRAPGPPAAPVPPDSEETEEPMPETDPAELPEEEAPGSKKNTRRQEKEKLQEYERQNEENCRNASEFTRNAYRVERQGNRRDFVVLGAVLFLAAGILVALVIGIGRMSTERIYNLIEQGNYSTAYHSLAELAEQGENIDRLVYTFCEACVEDSEYKRAVEALNFLSSEAEENTVFFTCMIESLLSHRKVNRAMDVMEYMYSHGETLSSLADQLKTKYTELS